MQQETIDRFFDKITLPRTLHSCWEWNASCDSWGYGNFRLVNMEKAHRVSWRIHRGTIPKDIKVCHKCDNPKCINPQHLFLGSDLDNTLDMVSKGRHASQTDNLTFRTICSPPRTSIIKSRFKGVSWHRAGNRWQAHINVKGKARYLGLFDTEELANEAYQQALATIK